MTAPVLCVLDAVDGERYNQFLMDGLQLHPATLRIAPEDVLAQPFDTSSSPDRLSVAAIEGSRWLGVGSVERELGRKKRRHIAWIVRMVVSEPNRGIGRNILRELKRLARSLEGIEKLNLTVARDNVPAVHLYQSEGFEVFAEEVDAFRVGGRPVVELSMTHQLRP